MRTRSTTTPNSFPYGERFDYAQDSPSGIVYTNITSTHAAGSLGSANDSLETIIDELVYKKRYGTCAHTRKVTWGNTSYGFYQKWTGPGAPGNVRTFERTYSGGYWFWLRFATGMDTWLTIPMTPQSIDWSQMSYEAMLEMTPSFNDGLSLLNDIIELKEIKSLLDPLSRKNSVGKLRKVPLNPLKRISNLYLWYKYGYKATLKSAEQIMDLIRRLPAALDRLRRNSEKILTRHYSRRMDHLTALTGDSVVASSGVQPTFSIKREARFVKPPRYHASLRFSWDVSRLSDLEQRVRAYLEGTGFTRPLSILWNAIPYSFVVDWFADVDKWITSLCSEPVIPIRIHDFCHSVEYEYRISLWSTEQGHGTILGATRTHSSYDRRRDNPSLTSKLELNMPSIDNVITGAALVTQRLDDSKRNPPRIRGFRTKWLRFHSGLKVIR